MSGDLGFGGQEFFTKKELISFGNYLLSKRRRDRIKFAKDEFGDPLYDDALFLERYQKVSHADYHNWKAEQIVK